MVDLWFQVRRSEFEHFFFTVLINIDKVLAGRLLPFVYVSAVRSPFYIDVSLAASCRLSVYLKEERNSMFSFEIATSKLSIGN